MTEDLVTLHWSYNAKYMEDKLSSSADRIDELEHVIAKIQHTNLRRDMNAKDRGEEIDRLCKEKKND